jgi:ATP-dependent Clp protease ATP-binding subunit ClpA
VLKEVADSNGQIILFIDEIHTVIGAGLHPKVVWAFSDAILV